MPKKKPTLTLTLKKKPTLTLTKLPPAPYQPPFPNSAQPLNGRKLANVQLLRSLQA